MPIASTERRKANEHREKLARKRRAKVSGRQPLRDPKYLEFIRSRACILCAAREQRWDRHRGRVERYRAEGVEYTDHTALGNSPRPVQASPTEAAHVGLRGLRQKCSDRETIPLCAEHHRTGPDSHHVLGKKFWEHHDMNREAWIAAYNERYEQEKA